MVQGGCSYSSFAEKEPIAGERDRYSSKAMIPLDPPPVMPSPLVATPLYHLLSLNVGRSCDSLSINAANDKGEGILQM